MATLIECTSNGPEWDDYIHHQASASVYHQFGWKRVIEKTFGHKGYFLIAKENHQVRGVLPLIFMRSNFFGRYFISLPFIDNAGVLADNSQIAALLCDKAIEMAQDEQVDFVELRNQEEVKHDSLETLVHKVHFVVPLNPDPQMLWKHVFHENIRNKVKKAWKNNLTVDFGASLEYLDSFYQVFSINMRDLGTPVYPRALFLHVLEEFPGQVMIFLVRDKNRVIGGKLVLLFKDTVYFIYHSSMREYAKLAPNNLLYWAAIEYACQNNYKICNMGRSTIGSGPFNFKKQWGGQVHQLYWQYYLWKANQLPNLSPSNPRFSLAINIWKRLPLGLTQMIGPWLAKHLP